MSDDEKVQYRMDTSDGCGLKRRGQAAQVVSQGPGAVFSRKRHLARALAESPTFKCRSFHKLVNDLI